MNGKRPLGSMPVRIGLFVDGTQVAEQLLDPAAQASFENDEQELDGKTLEFKVPLNVGERWIAATVLNLYDGLPVRFNGPNPSARPEQYHVPTFTPPQNDPTPERIATVPEGLRGAAGGAEEGAHQHRAGRPARTRGAVRSGHDAVAREPAAVYACGHSVGPALRGRRGKARPPHQSWCGLKNISAVAQRAFRRPVAREELVPYVAVMARAQKAGESFDEALAIALQARAGLARLPVPHRTGPVATTAGAQAVPVGEHELASRLSYFLWSSMPDAELRRLADRSMLRKPGVLEAQVRRMLADAKVVGAGRGVRRPVAAVPRPRVGRPRSREVPELRQLPAPLDAQRDDAVLRAHRP